MDKVRKQNTPKSQSEKFKAIAKVYEVDGNEDWFDRILRMEEKPGKSMH